MSYEPSWLFCIFEGSTSCHSIREMSSAYSYWSTYSSATTPASISNSTWLAYPSSYSSSTCTRLAALTHSGYRAKSQITAATSAGGAAITIDCVDMSAIDEGYSRKSTGRAQVREFGRGE